MIQNEINDEIHFWQWLIHWWEETRHGKAPQRMYDALELAISRSSTTTEKIHPENTLH